MSKLTNKLKGWRIYKENLAQLKAQMERSKHQFAFGRAYPCLKDRFDQSGTAKGHYFHQDLYVAQKIHINSPVRHIDIGSRVDGFIAHVASFREIEVLDVRPLDIDIPNIKFHQLDIMSPLDENFVESTDSLSSLHALEHFGLGRYGDPVNYDGYLVAFDNLSNMLKQCGKFYLSVPIGPERIEFDAHRVFSIDYLVEIVSKKFHIDTFSYVDDKGNLNRHVPWNSEEAKANYGCHYGCGILELTKL